MDFVLIFFLLGLLELVVIILLLASRPPSEKEIRAKLEVSYMKRIQALEEQYQEEIAQAVEVSKLRQRSTIKGRVAEVMAPLLPGFPCEPGDCRHLGTPIDYLSFDGHSKGEITGLTFIEIKTGESQLTNHERRIRELIDQHPACRFVIYNPEGAVEMER